MSAPRILLLGAGGFAGHHLATALAAEYGRDRVVATTRAELDITDQGAISAALLEHRPTHVVNLAGLAAPAAAARAGYGAWNLHLHAAEDLGRAILRDVPDAWLVHVGSGLIYGRTARHGRPVTEAEALEPMDAYGATKAAGDIALGALAERGLKVVRMRPFNHTGSGQVADFAAPAFASQIARIEVGRQEAVLSVGNLDAIRDFLHVFDVVEAYASVIRAGDSLVPGRAFNVASGEGVTMQDLLDRLLSLSNCDIRVSPDPARMRESDLPVIIGDARALRDATGWFPRSNLDAALCDLLNAERRMLS